MCCLDMMSCGHRFDMMSCVIHRFMDRFDFAVIGNKTRRDGWAQQFGAAHQSRVILDLEARTIEKHALFPDLAAPAEMFLPKLNQKKYGSHPAPAHCHAPARRPHAPAPARLHARAWQGASTATCGALSLLTIQSVSRSRLNQLLSGTCVMRSKVSQPLARLSENGSGRTGIPKSHRSRQSPMALERMMGC